MAIIRKKLHPAAPIRQFIHNFTGKYQDTYILELIHENLSARSSAGAENRLKMAPKWPKMAISSNELHSAAPIQHFIHKLNVKYKYTYILDVMHDSFSAKSSAGAENWLKTAPKWAKIAIFSNELHSAAQI